MSETRRARQHYPKATIATFLEALDGGHSVKVAALRVGMNIDYAYQLKKQHRPDLTRVRKDYPKATIATFLEALEGGHSIKDAAIRGGINIDYAYQLKKQHRPDLKRYWNVETIARFLSLTDQGQTIKEASHATGIESTYAYALFHKHRPTGSVNPTRAKEDLAKRLTRSSSPHGATRYQKAAILEALEARGEDLDDPGLPRRLQALTIESAYMWLRALHDGPAQPPHDPLTAVITTPRTKETPCTSPRTAPPS